MPVVDVPPRARVVIIGGGIIGGTVPITWPSRLDRRGPARAGQLSCGTTWHAAGIVGQLRTHPSLTRLMLDSSQLYATWRS